MRQQSISLLEDYLERVRHLLEHLEEVDELSNEEREEIGSLYSDLKLDVRGEVAERSEFNRNPKKLEQEFVLPTLQTVYNRLRPPKNVNPLSPEIREALEAAEIELSRGLSLLLDSGDDVDAEDS